MQPQANPFGRCSCGFSLIELLVVLSIIAILVGILLPVLSHVRGEARVIQCRSGLRQIGIAVHAYAVDNNDHVVAGPQPFGNHPGPEVPSPLIMLPDENDAARHTALGLLWEQDYLSTPAIFLCPSAEGFARDNILQYLEGDKDMNVMFGSYVYRQVAEATGKRIQALGDNSEGIPARAMAFHHTTTPSESADVWTRALSTVHHNAREVHILADDGHVQAPPPGMEGDFNFHTDYFEEYPSIVHRADRALAGGL